MNIPRKHIFAMLAGLLTILLLVSYYTYTYHDGKALKTVLLINRANRGLEG
jgi:hypothetical protein